MEIVSSSSSTEVRAPNSTGKVSPRVICETLDLAAYISQYDGYTKLKRLLLIADLCDNLQAQAMALLSQELKNSVNVHFFAKCVTDGNAARIPNDFGEWSTTWLDASERVNTARFDRLQADSLAAKSSKVNESIRLCTNDLGHYYYQTGNITEAIKAFSRSRDYCSTAEQVAEGAISVGGLYVDLDNFSILPIVLSKIDASAVDMYTHGKVKVLLGLHALSERNYKAAAQCFLHIDRQVGQTFNTTLSAPDIALYGALLGAATLEPAAFKQSVASSDFKAYLETHSEVQIFVQNYCSRKYGACLAYLASIAPLLQLDLYLRPHAVALARQVTEQVVLQYFAPYSRVSIAQMAAALSMSTDELEASVAALVASGSLSARIDGAAKVVIHRGNKNGTGNGARTLAYQRVQALCEDHLDALKSSLLRLSLLQNGLEVASAVDGGHHGGGGHGNSKGSGGMMHHHAIGGVAGGMDGIDVDVTALEVEGRSSDEEDRDDGM